MHLYHRLSIVPATQRTGHESGDPSLLLSPSLPCTTTTLSRGSPCPWPSPGLLLVTIVTGVTTNSCSSSPGSALLSSSSSVRVGASIA